MKENWWAYKYKEIYIMMSMQNLTSVLKLKKLNLWSKAGMVSIRSVCNVMQWYCWDILLVIFMVVVCLLMELTGMVWPTKQLTFCGQIYFRVVIIMIDISLVRTSLVPRPHPSAREKDLLPRRGVGSGNETLYVPMAQAAKGEGEKRPEYPYRSHGAVIR